MVIMTAFDIVKSLCEEQKLSIVELEERLNFSRNSLYSWKKNKPSSEKLEKVADYFNVSVDYILGRTDNKHLDEPNTIAAHMDDDLTEEEIEDIKEYIEFIKSKRK